MRSQGGVEESGRCTRAGHVHAGSCRLVLSRASCCCWCDSCRMMILCSEAPDMLARLVYQVKAKAG